MWMYDGHIVNTILSGLFCIIPVLCMSGRVMGSLSSSLVGGGVGWFEEALVISERR